MNPPGPDAPSPGLRWLSRGYAELRRQRGTVFDVLIVGSGYGGAMAAAELAGREVEEAGGRRAARICVLERGNEYAPGMFASSLQELPPHVRVHARGSGATLGPLDALLDVRAGPDVCTLTGNGLGGGSLINAGVMEKPRFAASPRLPQALVKDLSDDFLEQVKTQLQAKPLAAPLAKTQAMKVLHEKASATVRPLTFRPAALTVQDETDPADPDVPACTLCGDCMTGCNVGAKKSLDTTLLREAWRKGVEIYTGGSVIKVKRAGPDRWAVRTVYTDKNLRCRHQPVEIIARHVILAAGTLGSTEILMRSRSPQLQLSRKLGEQFSCNGDNLVALHGHPERAHSVADEWVPLDQRQVGPTITSVVQMDGLLLQEFSIPAALKRLFEETVTTARLLNDLSRPPTLNGTGPGAVDSFGVDADAMERTLVVGLIGHDEGAGRLEISSTRRDDEGMYVEGHLGVAWPAVRKSPLMANAFAAAQRVVEAAHPGQPMLPNPLWRLLPQEMEFLVKGERGPLLTVHPLGGCPMGESHLQGVVDHCGRVFDPQAAFEDTEPAFHAGLVVLDGSILPGSLGANPALTIAAVAKRAAGVLAAEWGLVAPAQAPTPRQPRRRPTYRKPEECTPPEPRDTEVELSERLIGESGSWLLELTLACRPQKVSTMMQGDRPALAVDGTRSLLRVYPRGSAQALRTASEPQRDAMAVVVARIEGELAMLEQELHAGWRGWSATLRALLAYGINRGMREMVDRAQEKKRDPGSQGLGIRQILNSAKRASEVRRFHYRVEVGEILKKPDNARASPVRGGEVLEGMKRLTYGLWSNPWRQLTEVRLTGGPRGLRRGTLVLDGRFLARENYPLLRIARQENQVTALAELSAWGFSWLRMLLSIHLWSFRAPDPAPQPHRRQLLPATTGLKRGRRVLLPEPQVREIELDPPRGGIPVLLRLTRYANEAGPPVALIHGYSASGTTFTHEAIPMPMAAYLHQRGYDVWVLDLRTSAGLPSARIPWHFEDCAFADLPVAIAHIRATRPGMPVHVIAHCIGAVMLSTALLADPANLAQFDGADVGDGGARPRRYRRELQALPGSLGKIVLSQKAPVLAYTDGNVLRAYFMNMFRRLMPPDFQFTVPTQPGLGAGVIDRVLSTMPYPDDEFRRENPLWPWSRAPWAGFRHRMDALYARDFSLKNIEDRTLAAIHELFGPLNLDTVAQAIHFVRHGTITDAAGGAIDTQGASLERWPRGGTMYVHGEENGLADIATLGMFRRHMARAGIEVEPLAVRGYGHQDCLIGRGADVRVFQPICEFLGRQHEQREPQRGESQGESLAAPIHPADP